MSGSEKSDGMGIVGLCLNDCKGIVRPGFY